MKKHSISKNEINKHDFSTKHAEELGMKVPENYFSSSKNEILNKLPRKQNLIVRLFSRKTMIWAAAASIALLFTFSIFNQNGINVNNTIPKIVADSIELLKTKGLSNENLALNDDDFLVSSLFIEENDIDAFVEDYILDELVFQQIFLEE